MEKIKKLLLITGANKGIGRSIIEGLLRDKNQDYTILLGTRSLDNGNATLKELKDQYKELANDINVAQIDITDNESVSKLIDNIKTTYKAKLTCLVNNAGVANKGNDFNTKVFDRIFNTNLFSTVSFTKSILANDLIVENGKIIFIGSSKGKLMHLSSEKLKGRFNDKELNEEKILNLAREFRDCIENDTVDKIGWTRSAYKVSKLCINKYAYVLGHTKDILDKGIQVYSCCPGWVRTDMGGKNGLRSLKEGSVTPVYLVNLKYQINKDFQGQFFYDEKVDQI